MADNSDQQWELVVEKLVRETAEGSLGWGIAEAGKPRRQQSGLQERQVSPVFYAAVAGKLVRLNEYDYWLDEDRSIPHREVSDEFVSPEGDLLWRFPRTDERWKLLDAVRQQTAGVADFLQSYLKAS